MRATGGSKPVTLYRAVTEARLRIDYLCKICQLLVLESDPEHRRELEELIAQVTKHNTDPESDHAR